MNKQSFPVLNQFALLPEMDVDKLRLFPIKMAESLCSGRNQQEGLTKPAFYMLC